MPTRRASKGLHHKTDSMGEFIWDFAWAAWSSRRPIPYRRGKQEKAEVAPAPAPAPAT